MTLSYLRNKLSTFVFLIFLSVCVEVSAGDSIPDTAFLKHCQTSDAYMLYSFKDVTYVKNWSGFKRYISISNKLVLNNSSGVDRFGYINLNKHVANNISEIKVRTLKANGSSIELDSAKIFERKNTDGRFDAIKYPIPGIEPGDTIETKYTYTEYTKKSEMMDFVYLQSEIPSFRSEYSIQSPPELHIRYKEYNELPEPQIVTNDSLIYCLFGMNNVRGLRENQNTCIPCQKPYAYYSMEVEDDDPVSWIKIYNKGFNFITQPIAFDKENFSYYNRWKRRVLDKSKDSSKFQQFRILHRDIMNNMEMESPRETEFVKSEGYFLKEGRINTISLRRLYRRLLEELEIDYWAVFARSKRAGAIDPYFIRSGEFDHVFFAFSDEDGKLKLLYPHDEYSRYHINEIPTALYNTEAVMVQPSEGGKRKRSDKFIGYDLEMAEADSVTVKTIQLPESNPTLNYAKQVYYVDIGTYKENFLAKYRLSVSGGVYTDIKGFFGILEQDDSVNEYYDALQEFEGESEIFELDTIISTTYKESLPFGMTMTAEGRFKDGISFVNDGIVSVSLQNILDHNEMEVAEEIEDLNYYLDYSYSDNIMLILKFPGKIEVLNKDDYAINFENDFGEYLFDLKLINDNEVTIFSNYKVTQALIPNSELSQLAALQEITKKIKNTRILVKLIE